MVSGTNPNRVRLTGENNYMRLHSEENGPETTRASHWRVLVSPGGPGHVLFLKSEITDDQVRIYSDNIAMTRWLQDEILGAGDFKDPDLPVISAAFSRTGDASRFWTELIESDQEKVSMTWYDFGEPFVTGVAAGSNPERPLGWSSVFVPARRAQLTLHDRVATGKAFPEERADGSHSSTAGLALSETWVRP
ncbi:MAG: hypothetical protein ACE5Q6_20020 [Dehalococcoidia bacterium]